jgi:hypothetical protein
MKDKTRKKIAAADSRFGAGTGDERYGWRLGQGDERRGRQRYHGQPTVRRLRVGACERRGAGAITRSFAALQSMKNHGF